MANYGRFFSSDVVKNFAVLFTGTALAQLIPFALSPVFTRLYSPADFGLFSVITSLAGILSVIACFRYEQAIVLPQNDRDARSIIAVALRIALYVTLAITVLFLFVRGHITRWLNIADYSEWLFVVPFLVVFTGAQQYFNYWLVRKKEFSMNAVNKVIQTSSIALISLVLGVMSFPWGLIVGYLSGWFVLMAFSYYQSTRTGFTLAGIDRDDRSRVRKAYREFPIYGTIPALLNNAASLLPVFYVSAFYGESETGFYGHTRLVILVPLSIVASSFSQVYFERAASKSRNREFFFQEVKKVFFIFSTAAAVVVLIVNTFGPRLFSFVFGDVWKVSGEYAQVLAFSYAVQFVVSPVSNVLIAINRMKLLGAWQFFYFILMLPIALFLNLPIGQFIMLLASVEVVAYLVYGMIIWRGVKMYENLNRIP